MGPTQTVRAARLISNTTLIPTRRQTRFGLRYVIDGQPHGGVVTIRMVTRFPERGLVDPDTSRVWQRNEYYVSTRIGAIHYRDYTLDHPWEASPGPWVFEFWIGERKLKEQAFCLYDPAKHPSEHKCD